MLLRPSATDRITRRAAAGGLLATAAPAIASASPPKRVVSLNPCLDVLLVRLADRSQIAALSHYARDPLSSNVGPIGMDLPIVYDTAEEVVAIRPDLVFMARYSSAATREALSRLGVRLELFDLPETIADSLAQVTRAAVALGHPSRGERLLADVRAAIDASAPAPNEPRLSAIVYQSAGFASAKGTLMDEMMAKAGLDNAAPRYGLKQSGNIPLEVLVADPPDVILSGQPRPGAPTWADRVLNHPAFRRLKGRTLIEPFPQRLMYCGGPVLIETAAMLAKARRSALAAGAGRGRS